MSVIAKVMDRVGCANLIASVKSESDKKRALEFIAKELDSTIIGLMSEEQKRRICLEVLEGEIASNPEKARIAKSDVLGGLAYLLIMFGSGFPVTLPFILMENLEMAIRISNLVAIGMLFAVGFEWGRHINRNGFLTGLAMIFIGLVIVGVTVALGG